MIPSVPRAMVVFAPSSAKQRARTAEVSRMTLLTVLLPGFLLAFADQFVHDVDSGHSVRSEGSLGCLDRLHECPQMDALLAFGQDKILSRLDAEVLSHVGRDDHAACRIDADASEVGFVGLRHNNPD